MGPLDNDFMQAFSNMSIGSEQNQIAKRYPSQNDPILKKLNDLHSQAFTTLGEIFSLQNQLANLDRTTCDDTLKKLENAFNEKKVLLGVYKNQLDLIAKEFENMQQKINNNG